MTEEYGVKPALAAIYVYPGSEEEYAWDPKGAMTMPDTTVIEDQTEEQEPQPMWELAECTCPDWCERDHELD